MKALITVAGSKFDATINSLYAIIKHRGYIPEKVSVFYSTRQRQKEGADLAVKGIVTILDRYLGKNVVRIEQLPFDEYRLDEFCAAIKQVLDDNFKARIESAFDITCGKKLVSGIMLKTGLEHRNKLLHIYYVYVTRKAYFDRWFPLRPKASQDVMDLLGS